MHTFQALLIKTGISTINTFLLTRQKLVYSCRVKIHALGFDKLLESIFCLLLVEEAFSLQNVVKILEEVVVFGEGQVNIVDETKLFSLIFSTFEALVV